MFQKASKQKLVALMAPISLAVGLSLNAVSANAAEYVISGGSGKTVVNNFGECWEAKSGVPHCGDILDSDGDGVPDDKDQCPNTPKGVPVDAVGCPKDSDGDGVPDYKDKCPGTPPGVQVDADGCEMVASLAITTTTDHFDFDSARLKPAMKAELDDFAARVNASPADEALDIVGHTDSTGSDAYNQGLSERRAASVAGYLSGKGIDRNKMVTSGMGERAPVASNATREGRARNRRVEINTK